MPIGAEDTFEGIIDLMTMKAEIYKSDDGKEYEITDIPAEYQEVAEARREMMIDAIAETDDDIMMKYLEGEEISIEELKTALRKAVIANQLFPVLCGSSYKTKVYKCYWTLLWITCQLQSTFQLLKVSFLVLKKKLLVLLPMMNHSPHWHSKSWLTLMLVN